MKSNLFYALLWCISLYAYNIASAQRSYYVSPGGNDNNPGTIDRPFATIHKARDVVRTVNGNMTGDINVYLRNGRYELASPLTLSTLDKGTNGFNIIYQAYRCEEPVLSGGATVTGWTIHDANKNIYKATVGTTVDTRQLYVNGRRAIRARTIDDAGWIETRDGYTCPPEVASWSNIRNVEVVSRKEWKCHRGPVAPVSDTHAVMQQPYWSELHKQFDAPVSWIENAYELLDSENEWYLNRSSGILFYKPAPGETMTTAEVILPRLESLVNGTNLTHVQFIGITFAHATWLRTNTANGFPCLQAGQLTSDYQIPGNLRFDHCTNLLFEGNTFEHLGVDGLQLHLGCKNNLIVDNVFRDISGSAVTVGPVANAYSFATPSLEDLVIDNTVDNNLVTNVAVEYEGCPGIFVGYTEHTVVTHNELRNLPYTGISAGWGWTDLVIAGKNNEIAYNYIDSVLTTLKDGAGIYTLGSQPGAQVHHNYINNVFNYFSALYPDEGSSNMHWHHNVVSNTYRYWLYMWKTDITNNTADYNYYDNPNQLINGTNAVVRNNFYVQNGNWPAEALSIMDNSGKTNISKPIRQTNLALNKVVSSSSDYSWEFEAKQANDGNPETFWAADLIERNPWWQIDLAVSTKMAQVELSARRDMDQSAERTNFEIRASNVGNFSAYTVLGSKTDSGFAAGGVWKLRVNDPNTYRYIRVQRIKDAGHFSFSEFRIYDTLVPPSELSVRKICIEPPSLFLKVSDTSKLNYSAQPSNAPNKIVSWTSDNPGIATVSATGLVTAKSAGKAKIIVTAHNGGKRDSVLVTVGITAEITASQFKIYPNPIHKWALISYRLLENSEVRISIMDIAGREVMQLPGKNQTPGDQQVTINTERITGGVYFVKLIVNGEQQVKKIIVSN